MSTKDSAPSWNDTPDPSVNRWLPRLGALVVLGVLLITLPTSHLKAGAMNAVGVQPSMLHPVGCSKVPPSAVDLLGFLDGQPPIPGRGVRACG
jgi:hypothetical protein